MRRFALLLGMAQLMALPLAAHAETYMGFRVGTLNAPPPPPLAFNQLPATTVVPGSSVYVVNDSRCTVDVFRYNVYWYAYRDGYWYRCRSHRGPFTVVDVRNVPKPVLSVPARHWRHYPLAVKQAPPHAKPNAQHQAAHAKHKSTDVVVVKETENHRH